MDIETGDRVRIITKNSRFEGMTGTVINVHEGEDASFLVDFEQTLPAGRFTSAGSITGFFASEVETVQEYEIELSAEDSVSATLELTEAEARTVRRVVDALQPWGDAASVRRMPTYAPSIEMKRKGA